MYVLLCNITIGTSDTFYGNYFLFNVVLQKLVQQEKPLVVSLCHPFKHIYPPNVLVKEFVTAPLVLAHVFHHLLVMLVMNVS